MRLIGRPGTAMRRRSGADRVEALAQLPASGYRQRVPLPRPNPPEADLVIIGIWRGSTSLAALKLARSRGVPVLTIVNVVGSSIARAADYVMYTYAGPESR